MNRWIWLNPYKRQCKKCGYTECVYGVWGTARFDEWVQCGPLPWRACRDHAGAASMIIRMETL